MTEINRDLLLNMAFEAAIEQLEQSGDFLPFAVVQDHEGVQFVYEEVRDEHNSVEEFIDDLLTGLRAGAEQGEYLATALVANVTIEHEGEEPQDAICVTLEDRQERPLACYLPYQTRDDKLEFGEPVAEDPEVAQVFLTDGA